MKQSSIVIKKGSIIAYRFFDVGHEIDLNATMKLLEDERQVFTFSLKNLNRSLVINEKPIVVALAPWQQEIIDHHYDIQPLAKLWSFGAISVQMVLTLHRPYGLDELCDLSFYLENDVNFHKEAESRVQSLVKDLSSAIEKPGIWKVYEDYIIFNFNEIEGISGDVTNAFTNSSVTSLILGEKVMPFANHVNRALARSMFQYSQNDLVLVHWNGALIYDPDDAEDIAFCVEFAMCQLLEMRYYDGLLDQQLNTLYQQVEQRKGTVFSDPYRKLSRQAALMYIEISEIVDRVSNASKIISDFYYATIYRSATESFQFPIWRKNIDQKLSNLAQVSKLFQGEINERRNQVLEITIIVLIAIEVFPYIYSLIGKIAG